MFAVEEETVGASGGLAKNVCCAARVEAEDSALAGEVEAALAVPDGTFAAAGFTRLLEFRAVFGNYARSRGQSQ